MGQAKTRPAARSNPRASEPPLGRAEDLPSERRVSVYRLVGLVQEVLDPHLEGEARRRPPFSVYPRDGVAGIADGQVALRIDVVHAGDGLEAGPGAQPVAEVAPEVGARAAAGPPKEPRAVGHVVGLEVGVGGAQPDAGREFKLGLELDSLRPRPADVGRCSGNGVKVEDDEVARLGPEAG